MIRRGDPIVLVRGWTVPAPTSPLPHLYSAVLTPSTSQCGLIWRSGFHKGSQAKIRSIAWTLVQSDRCPYRKGKFGKRHAYSENATWTWRQPSTSQRQGPEQIVPSKLAEGANSARLHLNVELWLLKLWGSKSLLIKSPSLWFFCYGSPRKLLHV